MLQQIASLPRRVKQAAARSRGVWLWPVLVALAPACGPLVDKAPFPTRFDSLTPGDLLGPFDGIVVDEETDRPVGGAVVAASWAFERGIGLAGPDGAQEVVMETTADGRYRVPILQELPSGGSSRVRRFTLIVYHRGHVGWRSDRRFPGGEVRRDFSQRGNRVRLEKWRPSLLRHRHLVFLGGGAAVKAASAWELQPASLELEGAAPGTSLAGTVAPVAPVAAGPASLDVSTVLSEDELRAVTGYAGAFDVLKLSDLPTTEFYDSRHFKAQGKPESYDVGVRVWRLGQVGAETQYAKLLAELPGAKRSDEIADSSLRAKNSDVIGLAFLSRERGVVVSVTCGVSQCTDAGSLLKLAKLIESRLSELPAAPATPPAEAPATPAPGPTTGPTK